MPVTVLFSADKYTYRLLWDEDTNRYVGVCSEFPDLRYEAASTNDALAGIQVRVAEDVKLLTKQRKTPPQPLSVAKYGR